MKYEDIKDFAQRCEEHEDHQTGMISTGMLACRMQEEIDELRDYIEQRTWVEPREWRGLSDEEAQWLYDNCRTPANLIDMTESKLKEINT